MSDVKPSIYAHCKAGCLWETVHKSDFLASAYKVKMPIEDDGYYYPKLGEKIICKNANTTSGWGFKIEVGYNGADWKQFSIEENAPYDAFADGLKIRWLSRTLFPLIEENGILPMRADAYIETDEKRSSYFGNSASDSIYNNDDLVCVRIGPLTDCYLINEDAKILVEGASAYEVAVANGFEGTEEEWLDSLKGGGGTVDNEKLAQLEEEINALKYKEIAITSFTHGSGINELGAFVREISFSWATNKTPTKLVFNGSEIDASLTSTRLSGLSLSETTTYSLTATDEKGATASSTTTVQFLNGVYYGVASAPDSYDSDFILSLTKELRSTKKPSFNVNAGTDKYIYYCVPKRFGTCAFTVGGFTGGFSLVATISFKNSMGYLEDYYIYRSNNAGLGSTTVSVS